MTTSSKKSVVSVGRAATGNCRLLRKPRLPTLVLQPAQTPTTENGLPSLAGDFLVEPEFYYENNQFPPTDYTFERSGTSPPPPSEFQANSSSRSRKFKSDTSSSVRVSHPTKHSGNSSYQRKMHGRFVLDPLHRENTNIGTYVEGHTLVQPYKPRGPDGLPSHLVARRMQPLVTYYETEEQCWGDERYEKEPEFTLKDFLQKMSTSEKLPLEKVQQAMFSRHNYKKIYKLLCEHVEPKSTTLTRVNLKPPGNVLFTIIIF